MARVALSPDIKAKHSSRMFVARFFIGVENFSSDVLTRGNSLDLPAKKRTPAGMPGFRYAIWNYFDGSAGTADSAEVAAASAEDFAAAAESRAASADSCAA